MDENENQLIEEQNPAAEGVASDEGESIQEQYERYFGDNADDTPGDDTDDADSTDESEDENSEDTGEASEDADKDAAEDEGEPAEEDADAEEELNPPDPEALKEKRLISEMQRLARAKGYTSVEEMIAEENGESAEEVTRRISSEEMTVEEKAAEYDRMIGKSKTEAAEAAGKAIHDRLLAEIRAEYPEAMNITSLADLPDPARFRSLVVEKGLSATDAYAVVTAKQTRAKAAKASEPSGKAHLVPDTRRSAAGKVNAPDDFLHAARDLYPDMTDAQIEKIYSKIK